MTAIRRVLIAVMVVFALVAASCGSDDSTDQVEDATTTTATPVTTEGADDDTSTTAAGVEEVDAEPATEVIQKLAQAMRDDDAILLEEVLDGSTWFIEWLTALRAEPEFTDCAETGSGVSCGVEFGDDFFYTQATGEFQESRIGGRVVDGKFRGASFPPPSGMGEVETEFREWVTTNRPELEDDLYGPPTLSMDVKMTRESGELRMELLDEFLTGR